MLVSASANALPPNAHAVGKGWKCNTGYKLQGQQCNKIFIPPNAVLRGQGWVCKTGFKRAGQQCNRQTQKVVKVRPSIMKPASRVSTHNQSKQMGLAEELYKQGDYARAFKISQSLASQGNATAQSNLGNMYATGEGTPKNIKQAILWWFKAGNQGKAQAQFNLGVVYGDGKDLLRDYKKAVFWYQKAADQGYAGAQHNLGLSYASGQGVLRDDSKAFQWYRKAAAQNFKNAQHSLGVMYCYGRGVAKNLRQCAIWIKKSHENGLSYASKVWDQFELWKHQ